MKTRIIFSAILLSFCIPGLFSQTPQKINYQAVVRNASGDPITETTVGVRLSIQPVTKGGPVCVEEFSPTTNEFGLITLEIGSVNTVDFQAIDWTADEYYLKVELDVTGGTNYTEMGITQLVSVPYALHAETAEVLLGDEKWQTSGDDIYYNDGNVGIGTTSITHRLTVNNPSLGAITDDIVPWAMFVGPSGGNYDKLFIYHNRYTDGTNWNSSEIRIQKQVDASPMHYISFKGLSGNNANFELGYNQTPFLSLDKFGKMGIGITNPQAKLHVDGAIKMTGTTNTLFYVNCNESGIPDNDGFRMRWEPNWLTTNMDALLFEKTDFNTEDPDGAIAFVNTGSDGIAEPALTIRGNGRVGVGTDTPTGQLQVVVSDDWTDEIPLFEVKNDDGIPVFAVFNNGVRIIIDDTYEEKGPKGGFAIGGYDYTKAGSTVDFMRITPDSIRFNINNEPDTKGPKGGFAIGGYDRTKGDINEDFLYVTPSSNGYNTFLGYESGKVNLGAFNSFIGYRSGYSNGQGSRNVFLGYLTGYQQTWATQNVFIGYQTGFDNRTGDFNVYIGAQAGMDNQSGQENVIIGNRAGEDNTSGSGNVIVGAQAGKRNLGGGNVFIGNWAGYYEEGSNRLYIDNSDTDEPLIFGYFTDDWVKINGQLRVRDVPYGDYQNVQWNSSNGLFYQDNSSRRYKENITILEDDYTKLLNISPKTYTRPNNPDKWEIGYIAEEFEDSGLTNLLWYDEEGRPDGINYEKIVLYSNENIKNNRSHIEELEKEIDDLNARIARLEAMISDMAE